jgi:hypothetical protein
MENNLDFFEIELYQKLKPINPNQEFINNLEERLMRKKTIYIEKRNRGLAFAIVGSGLFFGALFIWLMRRIF